MKKYILTILAVVLFGASVWAGPGAGGSGGGDGPGGGGSGGGAHRRSVIAVPHQ